MVTSVRMAYTWKVLKIMPLQALPVIFAPFKRRVNFTDLTGKRFQKWLVESFHGRSTKGKYYYWCSCACGTRESVRSDYLTSGISTSCGCSRNYPVHGDCIPGRTPEYRAWCSMKSRCLDEGNKSYKNYGGRGIKICPEWIESYEAFLRDVGRRPSPCLSIHRANNDGNYEPGNVVWASPTIQANHRRSSVFLTFQGKTQSVAQWAREIGINRHTLHSRLNRGSTVEAALSM
jgi:hypothetical protein